jgi:hypothetical protein
MSTSTLEYCIKCGGPHKRERCTDCHAWGRKYGMGRAAWAYRWNHDPGCSHYQPSHYPYAEQDSHIKAFGGKPLSDGTCPTTGVPALECGHCFEAADRDDWNDWSAF